MSKDILINLLIMLIGLAVWISVEALSRRQETLLPASVEKYAATVDAALDIKTLELLQLDQQTTKK